jgi:hypothetical protein
MEKKVEMFLEFTTSGPCLTSPENHGKGNGVCGVSSWKEKGPKLYAEISLSSTANFHR